MKLHAPSFFVGVAVGATAATIAPRLRAVALETATTFYKLGDAVAVRLARGREDFSDLLAEARARARGRLSRGDRTAAPPAHAAV